MGSIVALYSEADRTFYRLAAKPQIDINERRRLRGTDLRYCIGGDYIYLPAEQSNLPPLRQLCWARIHSSVAQDFPFHFDIGVQLPDFCTLDYLQNEGVYLGDRYIRRHRESDGRLVAVDSFCAQSLLDALSDNPEVLAAATKKEFEELCAELFARKGFKVDLLRTVKDGGVDFLAVADGTNDPMVFAVQCKHPDEPPDGSKPRALGRPTVQQIYGAAKGFDYDGAIAITSSTYSPDAKAFSELKPNEIKLYDREDLFKWISTYRWNPDETA
ncbi:MAG TPA: restriction endonuclease [Verrucomicrobiae bacterium]|jgi:hypothetical protein